jgi:hypothetical protein
MAEETVNVNPDGSTTFEGSEGSTMPPIDDAGSEETLFNVTMAKGTDPAIILLMVVLALGFLYYLYYRKSRDDADDFFSSLDGEKVGQLTHAPVSFCNLARPNILVYML